MMATIKSKLSGNYSIFDMKSLCIYERFFVWSLYKRPPGVELFIKGNR